MSTDAPTGVDGVRLLLYVGGPRHGTETAVEGEPGPIVDIVSSTTYYPETTAFVTLHPQTQKPHLRYAVLVLAHESVRQDTFACMQCATHVQPEHAAGPLMQGHQVIRTPAAQHLQNALMDAVMRRWFLAEGTVSKVDAAGTQINGRAPSSLIIPGR